MHVITCHCPPTIHLSARRLLSPRSARDMRYARNDQRQRVFHCLGEMVTMHELACAQTLPLRIACLTSAIALVI